MPEFCRGEFNCGRTWLVEIRANCTEQKNTDVGMWMMEKRVGNLKNGIGLVCVDSYRVAIQGRGFIKEEKK